MVTVLISAACIDAASTVVCHTMRSAAKACQIQIVVCAAMPYSRRSLPNPSLGSSNPLLPDRTPNHIASHGRQPAARWHFTRCVGVGGVSYIVDCIQRCA